MQTTQDVWIWDNPPEAFPAASTTIRSVCSLTTARWWNILCKSVDPEGDALLNTGAFQPDGLAMIKSIAATGKWAANVGANWIGKTTIQAGENAKIYTFTPTN